MRLLLTRHPAQAGDLEASLRTQGVRTDYLPLTAQVLPRDTAELTTAGARLGSGEFDWVLFTSAATVRALLSSGFSGEIPKNTRIGAVGPGTAAAVRELTGAAVVWTPQGEHSAAGILRELPHPTLACPEHREDADGPADSRAALLLPQSAQARPDLWQGLQERGWKVTHVRAYETLPLDEAQHRRSIYPLRSGGPGQLLQPQELMAGDVVLVTASSAAAELLALLPQLPKVRLLAIGAPTAETLIAGGRPADAVLSSPTAAAVLEAITS